MAAEGFFHDAHEVYAILDIEAKWTALDAEPVTRRLMVSDIYGRPAYLARPVRRNPDAVLATEDAQQPQWVGTMATEELAQAFTQLLAAQTVGYRYEVKQA